MHTALCSFDDRANADHAVDRLVQAGFDRRDIHVQHRGGAANGDGEPGHHSGTERWDTMEREVAVDPGVLAGLGRFFSSLFGTNDSPHASSYTEAVERGHYVVVVDAVDETSADHAQSVLRDLRGATLTVVHRPTQLPLREIVGTRQGMMPLESAPRESSYEAERAMASDRLDQKRSSDPRDDPTMSPGLRYADKDKPNG
ncbi:hypothetical protein LZ009_07695 [Ramlibacter sp. XY19]|uniref:hypothetical protein n=1 Tax=Ramlibacter paludis TaxID=2908000 RepID=UPI0023DA0EC9|nr:hypothetical protein [Ramlibacter paludis]MCG2592664.1 hypothetical protein [Ramlibacter paludis]